MGTRSRPIAERFNEKVDRSPGHGPRGDCWLWTAHVDRDTGYGKFNVDGRRPIGAHRVAFAIAAGRPQADGLFVTHSCDVRTCVNPAHLREATATQNMRDMRDRGRVVNTPPRGENQWKAILTEGEVRTIIRSTEPTSVLVKRFGVTRYCIWDIRSGRRWQHIPR